MEFIPSAPTDVPKMVLFAVCLLALLGGVPILGAASEHAKAVAKRGTYRVLTYVVALSAGFGAAAIFFGGDPAAAARYEAVTDSLDTYGLDLSKEERKALEYPRDRPDSDFEVFGSFTREGPTDEGFSRQTVYLIWKSGMLELASSPDGEEFVALPTD